MGFLAGLHAYLRYGYAEYATIPPQGLLIAFSSGFLPHGRGLSARLQSPDGVSGTLTIRSRAHYARPPDIDVVTDLSGEEFTSYVRLLSADEIEPCCAPIKDGWRTSIRGFVAGRAWKKLFVLGGGEYRYAAQSSNLTHVVETLLANGRQIQGQRQSAPPV